MKSKIPVNKTNEKSNEAFLKKYDIVDKVEKEQIKSKINEYITKDRLSLTEAQTKAINIWREDKLSAIIEDGIGGLGGTTKNYIDISEFLQESSMLSRPKRLLNGQLLFFKYMPVDKKFLERKSKNYYDIFPLIFVTESHRGGFQGINLHYLSPDMRMILFDTIEKLLPIIPGYKIETNRIQINYKKLKTSKTTLRFFAPCYRQYRWSGLQKPPIAIPYQFWKLLIEKDLGYFMKGKKSLIYLDSWSDIFRPPEPQKTKEKK